MPRDRRRSSTPPAQMAGIFGIAGLGLGGPLVWIAAAAWKAKGVPAEQMFDLAPLLAGLVGGLILGFLGVLCGLAIFGGNR